MKLKKDDILVLNGLGIEFMYGKDNSKIKKNKISLYKMKSRVDEIFINLETIEQGSYLGKWQADFFRLATPMEIKLYTVGEIFR